MEVVFAGRYWVRDVVLWVRVVVLTMFDSGSMVDPGNITKGVLGLGNTLGHNKGSGLG